jgi:hypothetical protein
MEPRAPHYLARRPAHQTPASHRAMHSLVSEAGEAKVQAFGKAGMGFPDFGIAGGQMCYFQPRTRG